MTNKTVTMSRELAELSAESYSVVIGMIEHCLNVRACMGMDEGFKDFDTEEEHDFVKEIRALVAKANDAAPVVERQEPAAYADPKSFENFKNLAHLGGLYAHEWMWANPAPGLVPLYTAPPAPVAVMLEMSQLLQECVNVVRFGEDFDLPVTTMNRIDACLDKVKELNQ